MSGHIKKKYFEIIIGINIGIAEKKKLIQNTILLKILKQLVSCIAKT